MPFNDVNKSNEFLFSYFPNFLVDANNTISDIPIISKNEYPNKIVKNPIKIANKKHKKIKTE